MRFGDDDTTTSSNVYWIPEHRLPDLRFKIDKLGRKADRLGVSSINYTIGQPETRTYLREVGDSGGVYYHLLTPELLASYRRSHFGYDPSSFDMSHFQLFPVTVTGTTPRLAGWEFVATLQHLQNEDGSTVNILRVVPGYDKQLPEKYRTVGPENCDHCHRLIRTRKETFIVRNEATGEYMQIGRSCTQDFLGGKNPQAVASALEYLFDALADAESAGEEGGGFGGGGGREVYPKDRFLTQVAACIRVNGWMSRGKAHEMDEAGVPHLQATADTALYVLSPPAPGDHKWREIAERLAPNEADLEIATKTIDYVRDTLAPKTDRNDYEHNLYVAMTQPMVHYKLAGILASAVPFYMRSVQDAVERQRQGESHHFGVVGERGDYYVTLAKVINVESMYGTSFLHKFFTREGNAMSWFASSNPQLETGKEYRITATIKKHDVYKGVEQTSVTRVTIYTDEGRIEAEAKEAKRAEREVKRAAKEAAKAAKDAAKAAKEAAKAGGGVLGGGDIIGMEIRAYASAMRAWPMYFMTMTITGDDEDTLESWIDEDAPLSRVRVEQIATEGLIPERVILDVDTGTTVDGNHRLAAGLEYGMDVPAVLLSRDPTLGWSPVW